LVYADDCFLINRRSESNASSRFNKKKAQAVKEAAMQ